MSIFTRKSGPVTVQDRLNEAAAMSGAALSVFHAAAGDLEEAARIQQEAGYELLDEAERLREAAINKDGEADDAFIQGEHNLLAADRIRDLFA